MTCGFMRLATLQFELKLQKCIRMGITIFKISFGEVYRRIYVRKSRFTVSSRVAVKLNFRPNIRRYSSPNENFEYSYPLNIWISPLHVHQNAHKLLLSFLCGMHTLSLLHLSQCMRFPTIWYVRPAKPQISLRIRAVWSEPLLVAWVFYDC